MDTSTPQHPKPPYVPQGAWNKTDFLINKHYWEKRGVETAEAIRRENLLQMRRRLEEAGLRNFLIGKTLRGLWRDGRFENDNDDDLGIDFSDRERFREAVIPQLLADGFRLIRDNEAMFSLERNFRYIDICLFQARTEGGKPLYGYASKWYDAEHFESLDSAEFFGTRFDLPRDPDAFLQKAYSEEHQRLYRRRQPRRAEPGSAAPKGSPAWFRSQARRALRFARRVARRLPRELLDRLNWVYGTLPAPFGRLLDKLAAACGIHYRILSREEFLQIQVEPDDSYNWGWRKRHLDPVTDSGRLRRVAAILDYLSDEEVWNRIDAEVVDTDTDMVLMEPINRDMDFWWGGSNYFWNCVKYGFRQGVIPYSEAKKYIDAKRQPPLYSRAYYESLPPMAEAEIRKLLIQHPIELTDGAVTSGKHRAFAMIGRLRAGQSYLPVKVVLKTKAAKA